MLDSIVNMVALKSFITSHTPKSILNLYHGLGGLMGSARYGNPSRSLTVIGVTGTKGKSTTSHMVAHILEHAGFAVGLLSTPLIKIRGQEKLNASKMTMLGGNKLQKLLSLMVKAGCTHAVVETSSQGLEQLRHWGIRYNVIVLTNFFPEHLEAHGGLEHYRAAKLKLWDTPHTISVLNADTTEVSDFIQKSAQKLFLFTTRDTDAYITKGLPHTTIVRAHDIHGSQFTINDVSFTLRVLGSFNVHNALAAATIALSLGIPLPASARALSQFKGTPGRMERIDEGQPFTVIVDYAHEPHGLKQVYESLMPNLRSHENTGGRLISVVGSAGGGRDAWRRAEIGTLAAQYADEIIVTNEDPYDEDPEKIINEVAQGARALLSSEKKLHIISDREQAIHKALTLAQPHDIVLFTGKGAEQWIMQARGSKTKWDEREIVRSSLKQLGFTRSM